MSINWEKAGSHTCNYLFSLFISIFNFSKLCLNSLISPSWFAFLEFICRFYLIIQYFVIWTPWLDLLDLIFCSYFFLLSLDSLFCDLNALISSSWFASLDLIPILFISWFALDGLYMIGSFCHDLISSLDLFSLISSPCITCLDLIS